MRLVLKVLSPTQVIALQSDIFDDVKKWLAQKAKEWSATVSQGQSAKSLTSAQKHRRVTY